LHGIFYRFVWYLFNPVLYRGLHKLVVYSTLRYNTAVEFFTPVPYMRLIATLYTIRYCCSRSRNLFCEFIHKLQIAQNIKHNTSTATTQTTTKVKATTPMATASIRYIKSYSISEPSGVVRWRRPVGSDDRGTTQYYGGGGDEDVVTDDETRAVTPG
jgi:hypothetical protein